MIDYVIAADEHELRALNFACGIALGAVGDTWDSALKNDVTAALYVLRKAKILEESALSIAKRQAAQREEAARLNRDEEEAKRQEAARREDVEAKFVPGKFLEFHFPFTGNISKVRASIESLFEQIENASGDGWMGEVQISVIPPLPSDARSGD